MQKAAKLLMFIGETEMQIEFARQNLCLKENFEPYAAFQRIDREGKGYISVQDIYNYLK